MSPTSFLSIIPQRQSSFVNTEIASSQFYSVFSARKKKAKRKKNNLLLLFDNSRWSQWVNKMITSNNLYLKSFWMSSDRCFITNLRANRCHCHLQSKSHQGFAVFELVTRWTLSLVSWLKHQTFFLIKSRSKRPPSELKLFLIFFSVPR